ncbi:hypothetical protein DFH27DRAFT_338973 [Peziza echinospora]|nr:hypothetical protein DFH27DRAFT_338973 [Peziza echinospora]
MDFIIILLSLIFILSILKFLLEIPSLQPSQLPLFPLSLLCIHFISLKSVWNHLQNILHVIKNKVKNKVK